MAADKRRFITPWLIGNRMPKPQVQFMSQMIPPMSATLLCFARMHELSFTLPG